MSVIKFNRNFSELFNWDSDADPTTEQEYQNAVRNWTEIEMNIVDTLLWQPETAYSVGNIAKTPSLPSQYILVCTEAGDSGVTEPDYTGVSVGDTVVDGTATWLVSTIANGGNIDALTTAVEANTQAIGEHSTAIATNAENIATNTEDIANNATDIEVADKRISNIEKLLQGNLYDYQTDSTEAYTKTVPAGAMPYAGLEKVGGKTVVWNQLVDLSTSGSIKGVTVTESNGVYSFSGTATDGGNYYFNNSTHYIKIIAGHKYLLYNIIKHNGGKILVRDFVDNVTIVQIDINESVSGKIYNANYNYNAIRMYFNVPSAGTIDTQIAPMFIDMTLMFGAGNEPSTVEEFESMFPASYYPYNEGELLSAGVTEVQSKKADTTTIATYSIPPAIRNLEGYGWSAGTAYNYVDFERKVFVQNVGSRAYASGDESNTAVTTDMTTTYYPLTTAVETDISEYITDDNLINVEAGGTLTFPNQNGTDYQIPVPSEETYMIDLQEAINNG